MQTLPFADRRDFDDAMRGFIATAPRVRLLVYSEAPETDLLLRELTLTRLRQAEPEGAQR